MGLHTEAPPHLSYHVQRAPYSGSERLNDGNAAGGTPLAVRQYLTDEIPRVKMSLCIQTYLVVFRNVFEGNPVGLDNTGLLFVGCIIGKYNIYLQFNFSVWLFQISGISGIRSVNRIRN